MSKPAPRPPFPPNVASILIFKRGMAGFAARVEAALLPGSGIRVIVDERTGPRRKQMSEYPGPKRRSDTTRRVRSSITTIDLIVLAPSASSTPSPRSPTTSPPTAPPPPTPTTSST